MKPKLRFKGFDEKWVNHKVQSIFTLSNGYTPSKFNSDYWENGTIPWFRMEDIRENGRILADSIQHVTEQAVKASGLIPSGSLILSTTATIGEHALLIADSLANQQFTIFQIVNRWSSINSKFWLYRFYKLGTWCRKNVNAGGLAAVNIDDLKCYNLIFPPQAKEQEQITTYLETVDSQIDSIERNLSRLRQIKAASLQAMFPQESETVPRLRFKGFTDEWKKCTIGDVATFSKGQGYSKADIKDSGTPIILYGRMYTNYSTVIESIGTYADIKNGSVISKGDEILIPASGETPEDIAIASHLTISGVIIGGDLNIINVDKSFLSPSFLSLAITYTDTHRELSALSQGKSVVHLHNGEIAMAHISYPPLGEQQKIADFFLNLDRQISLTEAKLEKLKQIKAACLNLMFV